MWLILPSLCQIGRLTAVHVHIDEDSVFVMKLWSTILNDRGLFFLLSFFCFGVVFAVPTNTKLSNGCVTGHDI